MLPLDRPDALPKGGPEIWVRRLKANEELDFYCASPKLWLVWVHWEGDHSSPCVTPHSKCPGHRQGLPRRVRAYLYGWNGRCKRYEFLELPPSCANETESLVMGPGTLRGKYFKFKRGAGKKARIAPSIVAVMSDAELANLERDRDPAPTLVRLWGIEDLPDHSAAKPTIPFAI